MTSPDQPRLLHRNSTHAYTTTTVLALNDEPEAVSETDQWLITREAADRELRAWATSRQRILAELEHLHAHVHSPHIDRGVRALKREIAALDRRLV